MTPLAGGIPLHYAVNYVSAAYIVVFAIVLLYVAIMAVKLTRVDRELRELRAFAERRRARDEELREPERALSTPR